MSASTERRSPGRRVHAVVLAAGGSSRLGQPKQLAQLGGVSLLRRAAEAVLAADVATATVVLGPSAEVMAAELAGLAVHVVHNPDWRAGVGSSIRCGVRALAAQDALHDDAGILFLLCDQPQLTTAHLNDLIAVFRSGAAIVASGYADTAGVPAIFAGRYAAELRELKDARGGKQLLEQHRAAVRVVPLPGGELDVDTTEDLWRAQAGQAVAAARSDFPALAQRLHDRPLVYLDTAATALKPRAVIDAVTQVYTRDCANVHRGLHSLSARISEAYEQARASVQAWLGARAADEIVFVRGATEALNLIAAAWAERRLQPGDRILITALEHHANLLPWQVACARTGAALDVAPIDDAGELPLDSFAALLTPRTRLVAVAHVSNVIGSVLPVRELARLAHAHGALLLVDGAQAAPHLPIDVQALECDFYALSGHKLYGPSGIGVLWARRELLAAMPPYQVGGDMVAAVAARQATYREPPYRFEAGTPNIEGAVGLGAAVRYLMSLDAAARQAHERDLIVYATHALSSVPGLRIIGRPARRVALICFWLDGIHPHDLATFLDGEGIAVRAGHHCAEPLLDRLGYPALTRVSFGLYSSRPDIDALVAALHKAREFFL